MTIKLLLSTLNVSEHPLWKEQIKARIALRDVNLKHWQESNVFSPVWWLLLIAFIVIWYLWWKFVNKAKLLEIVGYGLLVALMSMILDILGVEYVLWG